MKTKIINLYGGAGCGKSTIASGIFYVMKNKGMSVEIVSEYVKELAWEKIPVTKYLQPLIFGEQLNRISRLLGQVEYIITDSPLELSYIYSHKDFRQAIYSIVDCARHNILSVDGNSEFNILVERTKPYVKKGRFQNKKEAIKKDEEIRNIFRTFDKPFQYVTHSYGDAEIIVKDILKYYG